MARSLCSSPSSLSHDHHLFCNPISPPWPPKRTPFRSPFPLKHFPCPLSLHSPTCLQFLRVSIQDPISSETQKPSSSQVPNSEFPDENTTSSKSYIWVNPKSPRASRLRRQSYDARYAFLVGMSESLNSCNPTEEDVFGILFGLGDKIVEQDAVIVLNNMSNPETAPIALKYFQQKLKLSKEVILYNVTLKVFRKCKDLDRAQKLFDEMLQRGVKPDNVTFSTIISCARLSSLPEKAVEWYEKMPSYGCEPDDVNSAVMIDAYGRAGNIDMALSLYDRARAERWRIDALTFSTLIKIYGMSGNFDGCLNVYEEMKALGIKPNLVVYNTLLDAMGRAKRPWQAKSVYKEMINNGFTPNWATYAALLRAFGRARYGEDGLNVYREMKGKGMELNVTLYNTLLAMCADVGYIDEAVEIFEDMKKSETCKPDSWTYSSLITIYSCSGKVSEAEATLNEMIGAGFEPNIFVLTSLIQCYGKANQTDDVIRTFNRLSNLGITPDDRFCCCLLNVMTQTPNEDLGKLAICIGKANSKLGYVVKLIVEGENIDGEIFKREAHELFNTISTDVKKAFCNCLIDLCVNLNMLERACELLDLGLTLEIYTDIQSKSPTQWSLHLKSLSLGAALTALHVWMNDLSKALENGEELPCLLGINTGHGKHKYSDKGLAVVFESHLKELDAPFHEDPDKVGWFLTTKVAAESWLESRRSSEVVAA
ncbi:pentatricopeptide repeat-containing protein At4g16390, chloroplastic [Diospyros lotus]|uniref:pentatricopeptide repeat-containing protein At4g16390, chloroplastic n=1 Tax=Diospyros lotus TaxID=55363 RepID=UPI00225690C6|nr:pentatricopeptide repeat-containing protein At4g16390, chloroplastic [Diospyros lotus]